jgi:S1-C subfamily serine protease
MSRLSGLLAATALALAPATAAADNTSIWSAVKAKLDEVAAKAATAKEPAAKDTKSNASLGVELLPVTPELRAHYGSKDGRGVLVGHVDLGSPAQLAGIQVGDLLLDIGGMKVEKPADAVTALANAGSERVLPMTVLRDKKRRDITVHLDHSLPIIGELMRVFTTPHPTCT